MIPGHLVQFWREVSWDLDRLNLDGKLPNYVFQEAERILELLEARFRAETEAADRRRLRTWR